MSAGPQRIVCLTEETTEWLYLLGEEERIVGISGYTVRPRRARNEKPRISSFLDGKIDRIVALRPDLVVGFSDMQAALADKLIRAGLNVLVTNQRSVAEVLATMRLVANLVGAQDRGERWIEACEMRFGEIAALARGRARPRVYFEEWDEPMISAIQWVSELIGMAGGDDIFPELGVKRMGRDRVVADPLEVVRRAPDVVVGSWCGKKFRPEKVAARSRLAATFPAVRFGRLHEIKSCDILQPGPAALTDGLEQLHRCFAEWSAAQESGAT